MRSWHACAGCICKLMYNCGGFSLDLAMAGCLTMGVKAGVDPTVLVEVFQKCALGRNFAMQRRLPETLFRGNFEPRFALEVAYKDMSLDMELSGTLGVPMSLTEVCGKERFEAMSRGWGDGDSSIFLTLQD